MNCKPGDLAIVVGIDAGKASNTAPNEYGIKDFKMIAVDIRGTIVKCIKPFVDDEDWGWEVEPREVAYKGVMSDGKSITASGILSEVPDRILCPLPGGDLGEDVFTTDELPSDKVCKVAA